VENAADAIEKLTTKVTMTEGNEFGGRFSKNRVVGAARGDFWWTLCKAWMYYTGGAR